MFRKNKRARDLFESMGFKYSKNPWAGNMILYRRINKKEYEDVEFDLDKKTYSAHYSNNGSEQGSMDIDRNIHKAILKQLKELKWF
jgi:hypothetical protein